MMMLMMQRRTYYDQNIENDQNLQWVLEAEKLNYKEREVFQLRRTDRVVLAHHLGARTMRISVMIISMMRMMQTIIVRVIMMMVENVIAIR